MNIQKMQRNEIEIMSPAGSFECLTAAIQGAADAVYFGVGTLNMRARSANNFTVGDLPAIVDYCGRHDTRTYLTVNTVIYDDDLPQVCAVIDAAKRAGVSAVIVSDPAVIAYAAQQGVEIHLSTQLNIASFEALKFYAPYADVAVLARELTLEQVERIHRQIVERDLRGPGGQRLRLEMFVHGALCMAVSGKCYLSLHEYNASANRGNCYQVCRRSYTVRDRETDREFAIDNQYIMSPKDLCTIGFLDRMYDAGIRIFKIEGRARSAEYVKTVTRCYSQAADALAAGDYTPQRVEAWRAELATVFNRGFWDGYYLGRRLGEWSEVYGNKASKRKVYLGKITNCYNRIGVVEIQTETGALACGDEILIMGATTGVVETTVGELRVDNQSVEKALKGELCSVPVSEKVHRGDKIYKLVAG
jgi:putative protease